MVDAWRLGPDIALQAFGAQFLFMPSELQTLSVRWPYCRAVLCDADPAILRDLSADEVSFGAGTVMAAGGGWWLSDDLTQLPAERLPWGGATPQWTAAALIGQPAVPEPLFASEAPQTLASGLKDFLGKKSTHAVPTRWRLPDKQLMLFNLGEEASTEWGMSVPARAMRLLAK